MQGRRHAPVDEMMVNNRRNLNKTGLFEEVDLF